MTVARLPRLDALRCVAVLLVIARHSGAPEPAASGVESRIAGVLHEVGWVGVDLFFVLSGFLVSGLLFREHRRYGTLSVKGFLIRRGLKIYPAFYIYTAFVIAAAVALHRPLTAGRVLAELLFVQNYFPGVWWTHTWSLAVEEHFYLLVAVAVWLMAARAREGAEPFRAVIPMTVIVAVGCLVLRIVAVFVAPVGRDFYLTHLRIDSLMFGVFLSYLFHYRRPLMDRIARRWGPWLVLAAVVVALQTAFFSAFSPWMRTGGFTTLYLAFGAIVVVAVCRDEDASTPASGFVRAMARVGVFSYSIYLWHRASLDLALIVAHKLRVDSPLLELLLEVGVALAVGIGAAKLIEIPVLEIRDRLIPSRSGTLA